MRTVLLAALSLFACAAPMTTMAYVPQKTKAQLAETELRQIVVDYVVESGWQLRVDGRDDKIVAVTPIEMTSGVPTRQVWTFDVRDYEVTASMLFEAQFDEGEWTSSSKVCGGYRYLREQVHLDAIAARAADGPSSTAYAWRQHP